LAFPSCKHEPLLQDDLNNNNNNGSVVCFETQILPLFQTNCAKSGCHDANTQAEGLRFDNYNGIMDEIVAGNPSEGDIMEAIVEEDPDKVMPPPPAAQLTEEQIALLTVWILQGAQNTTGCNSSGCGSSIFTYSAGVAPIMQTYCNGCHSAASPSAGIITSNYQGLSDIAQSGKLAGAINHSIGYSPMPKNGTMLDICSRTKITKWIDDGFPNN
jgi:mono/diheme cytochrome c family protein